LTTMFRLFLSSICLLASSGATPGSQDPPVPDQGISLAELASRADVVVLGSHGKNWVDRLLLGSTTERLIADLPSSLLVAPAARDAPEASRPELLGAAGR